MPADMESFLSLCKECLLEGITPSNKLSHYKNTYNKLVAVAKQYFDDNLYDDFAGFFLEGQYFISLWAAHVLVEHGKPSAHLLAIAINTIKDYSDNTLAPQVAKEERQWLNENGKKY